MVWWKSPVVRRWMAVVLCCVALSSCFDPPVQESLLLRFLPNGAVVATSTVEITDHGESNPALARRLAETRRALLEGSDAWGARFAAAEPAAERFSWEKRLGDLQRASRSAAIAEPASLAAVFGDSGLGVTYEVDASRGIAELAIVPGASTRATRKQREEMDKALGAWTAALAEYLEAAADLYAYLEDRPERARACFGTLFAERLSDDEVGDLEELTREEKRVVDRLDEATRDVLKVLAVPGGSAYSLDEVSHLVYDPFPARLSVKLPGPPLAVEGFQSGGGNVLTVASPGLWEALKSLEGRWITPDPVLFYVASAQGSQETLDLDAFLQKPRQTGPVVPTAKRVRAAVEERLRTAPLYRVSWRVQPEDDTEFKWEEGEGAP